MIKDLTQDERLLANIMSRLSERCYSAAWMDGLEYVLWHAVTLGPRYYGHDRITFNDIDRLIHAYEKANAWILFDDTFEEIAVPLDKWKTMFAEKTTHNPDILHW